MAHAFHGDLGVLPLVQVSGNESAKALTVRARGESRRHRWAFKYGAAFRERGQGTRVFFAVAGGALVEVLPRGALFRIEMVLLGLFRLGLFPFGLFPFGVSPFSSLVPFDMFMFGVFHFGVFPFGVFLFGVFPFGGRMSSLVVFRQRDPGGDRVDADIVDAEVVTAAVQEQRQLCIGLGVRDLSAPAAAGNGSGVGLGVVVGSVVLLFCIPNSSRSTIDRALPEGMESCST